MKTKQNFSQTDFQSTTISFSFSTDSAYLNLFTNSLTQAAYWTSACGFLNARNAKLALLMGVLFSKVSCASSGYVNPFELSSLNGKNGFVMNGISSSDASGRSVTNLGDINGDGYDDIAIGALYADPNDTSAAGETYVLFGGPTIGDTGSVDLSSLDGTDGFVVNGIYQNENSGRVVAYVGDLNGDGFNDLLVSARGGTTTGNTYVIFGGAGVGYGGVFELSALNGTNGFMFTGVNSGYNPGVAIAGLGDVNDDGFPDIIIGAPGANPNGEGSGASYVVFGNQTIGATGSFDLSSLDGSNGFVINGIDTQDYSGTSVSSAGDVNGDGRPDIFIGAYQADPNGVSNAGESYVLFGNRTIGHTGSIELSNLNGKNGFVINGIHEGDGSSRALASAGDVNGDGFDDMLIGAYQADPYGRIAAGATYLLFGDDSVGETGVVELSDLDGSSGFVLYGTSSNDYSAYSVSSLGDINNDGLDDLIIGAWDATSGGNYAAGKSYVIYGNTTFYSVFNLSDVNGNNGFVINGIDETDQSGYSVSTAGDINGDNVADILVSAPGANSDAGATYLIFGNATHTSSPTQAPTPLPNPKPTKFPTASPTSTLTPTSSPSAAPYPFPTLPPTVSPTTFLPTGGPTWDETGAPSLSPSSVPSLDPTVSPTTFLPTGGPTWDETGAPSLSPSSVPSLDPTVSPTTFLPTGGPTWDETGAPSLSPSSVPSLDPTVSPTTFLPTGGPTWDETGAPSVPPSFVPTSGPTESPTTFLPSVDPTTKPSLLPTEVPTRIPTRALSGNSSSGLSWVLIGAIGGGSALLLLSILGLYCFRWRNKKTSNGGAIIGKTSDHIELLPVLEGGQLTVLESRNKDLFLPIEKITLGPLIASGAFGQVYQGTYVGEKVAVKRLKLHGRAANEELLREAEKMKSFKSEFIVQLRGLIKEKDGRYGLVMECMESSLYELLHNFEVQLTWEERLDLASNIASGLRFLHGLDFLHRDLKSLNVLVRRKNAKLADFGFAKLKEGDSLLTQTPRQHQVGTARWLAPELISSPNASHTPASDVFSLGLVFLELVLRAVPFEETNDMQLVMLWISNGTYQTLWERIPQDCPEMLREAIKACGRQTPGERPKAADLANAFEALLEEEGSLASKTLTREKTFTASSKTQSLGQEGSTGSAGLTSNEPWMRFSTQAPSSSAEESTSTRFSSNEPWRLFSSTTSESHATSTTQKAAAPGAQI